MARGVQSGPDAVSLMDRPYQVEITCNRAGMAGPISKIIGKTIWCFSSLSMQAGFLNLEDAECAISKLIKKRYVDKATLIKRKVK